MKIILGICLLYLANVQASPQIKSVKGYDGPSRFHLQNATDNLISRFYNTNNTQYHGVHNNTPPLDLEKGVCYIEVPTASLAKDPAHIPAGNGSRPDLSRIRTCCKGFIRNIHNFRRCDPVCEPECINALCTAPGVCTCYPDHVKNAAGFCIPTCPIGCQNGHCAGGECMCDQGYKLDVTGKFCVPVCQENCGGIGNCTEPNICSCKPGYKTTPQGNCLPSCDHCSNGDCVAPNDCRCREGYKKSEYGECVPHCPNGCGVNGQCIAPNQCSCPLGQERDTNTNQCTYKCAQPCINGVCTGSNTCSCNTGYVPDRTDPTATRCIPHCPDGCPNGVCSGPNFCICNMGYVKDRSVKGRQTCVKRIRRSVAEEEINEKKPLHIAELLVFEIPDDEE